jgi:hypothetical protein
MHWELDVGAVVVVGLALVGVGVLLSVQNGRFEEAKADSIISVSATINKDWEGRGGISRGAMIVEWCNHC